MNKYIRIIAIVVMVVLAGAFAKSKTNKDSTTFEFNYPQYLYVYTNLGVEQFDFAADKTGDTGTYTTEYKAASFASWGDCLEDLKPPKDAITAQDSPGSDLIKDQSCDFVATNVKTNGKFTVNWDNKEKPDGALLVLTNVSDWVASAHMDPKFSEVDEMVTLKVRVDENKLGALSSSKIAVGSKSGSKLINAYYTNFINAYVIPLQYVMVLDTPFSIPEVKDKAQVIYTVASP